jgi:hypothetical protein
MPRRTAKARQPASRMPTGASSDTPATSPATPSQGPVLVGSPSLAEAPPDETAATSAKPRFFSPTSFWNAPLPASAPLDPASASLAHELRAMVETEVAGKWGPYMSTTGYSTPIYTVPVGQPTVYVKEENPTPCPALQTAFSAVPIPPGAQPAAGSDAQLTVWQPSRDRLWEFWRLTRQADGWHARWGGAMERVAESPGYFTSSAWPGAQYNWGATATSLPLVGGLITLEDLQKGAINHALALSLPASKADVWSWPAQRSDAVATNPGAVPQGTRFRLDPALNIASLGLPKLTRMIAVAAQRYGIVVRDTSGVVDFYGEDPTPSGTNAWKAAFEGQPVWQLLSQLPWARLQALRLTPCSQQPCPLPSG